MAIVVNVSEPKPQERKDYPKLMISKETGNIVLMTSAPTANIGVGIVLVVKNTTWNLGDYSNNLELRNFTDFNEEITLKNE